MKKKTLSDDCLNQQQEKLKNRQKEPPWRGSALFLEGFLGRPLGLRQLFQELFGLLFLSGFKFPPDRIDLAFGAPPTAAGPHSQAPASVWKPDANRLIGHRLLIAGLFLFSIRHRVISA